jgi:hypothetical protein
VNKVKYRGEESLYVAESQREELMTEIMEVKEVPKSLQLNVTQQRSTNQHVPIHEEMETI